MMFAVIVASTYEKPVNTADDLLKSGKSLFFCNVTVALLQFKLDLFKSGKSLFFFPSLLLQTGSP